MCCFFCDNNGFGSLSESQQVFNKFVMVSIEIYFECLIVAWLKKEFYIPIHISLVKKIPD